MPQVPDRSEPPRDGYEGLDFAIEASGTDTTLGPAPVTVVEHMLTHNSANTNPVGRCLKRVVKAWLVLSVHLDAFRLSPGRYLTAAKWWVLRKRVRAYGQFAPLLNRSSKAYSLWGLRNERDNRANSPPGFPPIIALIDCAASTAGLEATKRHLAAEGIPAFVIGLDQNIDLRAAIGAIDWSGSPWLMVIEAGSQVAAGAAAAYRSAMTDPAVRVIYSDDDLIDKWGRRTAPHFKPDWNSELFRHFDYVTGSCVVRVDHEELGAVVDCHDWAARLVASAATVGRTHHLQQVLFHRATRVDPPATAQPLRPHAGLPLVSVIVPTRNRVELLRTCLDGLAGTNYPKLEIIVVDNDSDDPETLAYLTTISSGMAPQAVVLRHSGPFNYSAINNQAVKAANGQLICLLNNDIEMLSPDWLAIMATQALRDDVGAVGAQLLYPDGRIQHAGVVIGVGNAAGHAHRFIRPSDHGYFRRHAMPQFTAAVTAACLVVQRDRFLAVGGLDEQNFAVAFNDVDLCLKLSERGWQSLYEPRAALIHHESVSRGNDLDPVGAARFAGELAALQRIWKTDEIVDPFHHPNLSRSSEQFAIAI